MIIYCLFEEAVEVFFDVLASAFNRSTFTVRFACRILKERRKKEGQEKTNKKKKKKGTHFATGEERE